MVAILWRAGGLKHARAVAMTAGTLELRAPRCVVMSERERLGSQPAASESLSD